METNIKFYLVNDPYGCFSNFAAYPIRLHGKTWPTTEHYFQAQKFADVEYQEKIRKEESPMVAARMGRDRKQKLRHDWDSVKDIVMLEALRAKFTQHEDLKEQLLQTGNVRLVEHTENDSYWADGGDGHGKNRLGELLMQLRRELIETAQN